MEELTVVQINTFPYKAIGSIMMNLHKSMLEQGINSYVVWGRGRNPEDDHEISMEDKLGIAFHGAYSRITDKTGFASKRATRELLRNLEKMEPDIIHLHNVHGYYINIELLFEWFRAHQTKIVWTLHDCWSFTGHCAFYEMIGCDRWKTGCSNCPQKKTYPASYFMDSSSWNWKRKRELLANQNLSIITPCEWLKEEVADSFLGEYSVRVIYNGINTDTFSPIGSDIRKNYGLENKILILGVASEWTERKGLKDFIKLDAVLEDELKNQYKIVLVGLTKKQISKLPENILGIERTSSVKELVEFYTAADVLLNPTYEDNYPTVNLEALCCGTPVITYRTGGSPESIERNIGCVFEKGRVEEVARYVVEHAEPKLGFRINTQLMARKYGENNMVDKYVNIYRGGGINPI